MSNTETQRTEAIDRIKALADHMGIQISLEEVSALVDVVARELAYQGLSGAMAGESLRKAIDNMEE